MNAWGLKIAACAVAIVGLVSAGASAAEVTLKAVSAFAENTTFSKNFERLVDRVNTNGKGLIRLNYLGGGSKVMNPFELGKAIQTGIVDIGNLPGAFYTNLVPEADAIKLSDYTITEERKNGAWEYMNELHMKKMNAWHLARQKDCVPFHLYLNRKVDPKSPGELSTMLDGYKIRTTPIYSAFFKAMGGEMLRTAPGEVYTALERGTVDGYGWPIQGVLDLGWHEVTKYRVDPGFYRASVEVLVNLDTWKKLGKDQKAVLNEAARWMESLCQEDREINARERERQAKAGIKTITFPDRISKAYLDLAYKAGWDAFVKANPDTGPKLRKLLSK